MYFTKLLSATTLRMAPAAAAPTPQKEQDLSSEELIELLPAISEEQLTKIASLSSNLKNLYRASNETTETFNALWNEFDGVLFGPDVLVGGESAYMVVTEFLDTPVDTYEAADFEVLP
ncbi:hypothetical protein BJX70DRAFT_404662 [Aspergillus crustosus]